MKLSSIDRKKFRVRKKLKKVSKSDRFRLSVFRSAKNISAQIIDDRNNVTLLSVSSIEKDIKTMNKKNKTELSKIVAEKLAKKAQDKKITKICSTPWLVKYFILCLLINQQPIIVDNTGIECFPKGGIRGKSTKVPTGRIKKPPIIVTNVATCMLLWR